MNILKRILLGTVFAAAAFGTAQAAEGEVRIVLNEDLNNVEPCMASQSNIGRVLLQNISVCVVVFFLVVVVVVVVVVLFSFYFLSFPFFRL